MQSTVLYSQFADVCEVDEGRLLGAHSHHLRRLHDELPLLSGHHVGVPLPHDVKHPIQQLQQNNKQYDYTTSSGEHYEKLKST